MFSLGVVIYMLVSGGYEPFWDGSDIRFTVRKQSIIYLKILIFKNLR